jgi:hypothetical protein
MSKTVAEKLADVVDAVRDLPVDTQRRWSASSKIV